MKHVQQQVGRERMSRVQAAIELSDRAEDDDPDITLSDWLDDSGHVDESHFLSVEPC